MTKTQTIRKINRMHRQPQLKLSKFRKKQKQQKIEVISRRSQGARWKQTIKAPKLDAGVSFGGNVASSWIAEINWYESGQNAYMRLLNDYEYFVFIPFSVMQAWYYSTSKGTFFNYMIKDKYKVVRIR